MKILWKLMNIFFNEENELLFTAILVHIFASSVYSIRKTPVDLYLFFSPPQKLLGWTGLINDQETIIIFNEEFIHIQWNWISILHDVLGIVFQTSMIFIWRHLLCFEEINYSVLNKEEVHSYTMPKPG